jgi:hypothetical protein
MKKGDASLFCLRSASINASIISRLHFFWKRLASPFSFFALFFGKDSRPLFSQSCDMFQTSHKQSTRPAVKPT